MLTKLYKTFHKFVLYSQSTVACNNKVNISSFLYPQSLLMSGISTSLIDPCDVSSQAKLSSISMPLSPKPNTNSYVSLSPLSPPPFNTALGLNVSKPECLTNMTSYASPGERTFHKNSNNDLNPTSVKSEQCYQLPETKRAYNVPANDNQCYELPATDSYTSPSVSSRNGATSENYRTSHDSSCGLQTDIYGQINHKKEIAILKSSENVNLTISPSLEKEKTNRSDAEPTASFSTPVSRIKFCREHNSSSTPPQVKRYHSDTVDDGDFTPTRKNEIRKDRLIRFNNFELPQSKFVPGHGRKSLPAKTEYSPQDSFWSLTDRRKSFSASNLSNFSPSPSRTYKRCTTDQTPYAAADSFQQRKRMRTLLPYYNAFELNTLESKAGFIDSHCHLDFLFDRQGYSGTFSEYQQKHQDTFPKCYKGCLAVFCNPFTFNKVHKWQKFLEEENVWAAFGCHPHNAKDYNDDVEQSLCAALKHSKVRALGEIGLDYSNRNNCLKDKQFEVFKRQLKIALKKELPVVIHCREAHADGISIIKEILPKDYTIHLHCFTDTWEWAQKWINEFPNLFIGITNVVTFPSAESVHEVARNIPLDRLLLETDTPYFIPRAGPRGIKHSHPGMAIHVAAQIAALKDMPLEKVLQATRNNTNRMYNI